VNNSDETENRLQITPEWVKRCCWDDTDGSVGDGRSAVPSHSDEQTQISGL